MGCTEGLLGCPAHYQQLSNLAHTLTALGVHPGKAKVQPGLCFVPAAMQCASVESTTKFKPERRVQECEPNLG